MKMASAFKIVVALLVSLQLSQEASISSDFLNPINNKLTSHSSYLPPDVNTNDQTKYDFIGSKQLNNVKIASDSSTDSRLKRQVSQDLDADAEILPNNPDILKYGKSMPIEHHGSGPLNEDVDAEVSNKLLEEIGLKEGNDTANKVQKIENNEHVTAQVLNANLDVSTHKSNDDEQVHDTSSAVEHHDDTESHGSPHVDLTDSVSQVGLLEEENEEEQEEEEEEEKEEGVSLMKEPIRSQDGTHTNHNNDNSEESSVISRKGYLTSNPLDDDNIEENLLHEVSDNSELNQAENVVKEGAFHEDNVPLSINDMKKDELHVNHDDDEHEKSTVKSEIDSTTANTPIVVNSPEEKDDKETEFFVIKNKASVHDDTEEESPFSRLRAVKNDTIHLEEGSGDEEDVTVVPHGAIILDENEESETAVDASEFEEASAADNMDFNIDSEITSDQNQLAEKASEEVSPILDPTQNISKDDGNSKALTPSKSDTDDEVLVPEPTENSTNADVSLTYDPETIVNPFNIDKGLEISESIGQALGIAGKFEKKNESKEFEGSGDSIIFQDNDNDKDSLEDDDVMKVDPRILLTDDMNEEDHSEGHQTTELPMVSKHHPVLFNPVNVASINEDGTDGTTTESNTRAVIEKEESTAELPIKTAADLSTGSRNTGEESPRSTDKSSDELSLTALVNQENEKIEKESAEAASTTSSSTGSFIVLGAIMATVVLLLCYSVIKSHRQKQRNLRKSRPQESEGTELKEKITLLPDENGHRPGNGNVETGKLLSAKEDGDLKDDDSFPNSKIANGENGTGNQYKDPTVLTEVKVSTPNAAAQSVANGGLNSPDSSRRPGEPGSDEKASLVHGIKHEITKAKIIIDTDSIPKTPIVIVKRGPANVEI